MKKPGSNFSAGNRWCSTCFCLTLQTLLTHSCFLYPPIHTLKIHFFERIDWQSNLDNDMKQERWSSTLLCSLSVALMLGGCALHHSLCVSNLCLDYDKPILTVWNGFDYLTNNSKVEMTFILEDNTFIDIY